MLGPTELMIILVILLLLFGGTKLAGIGKSSGRAIREFKEETKGLTEQKAAAPTSDTPATAAAAPAYREQSLPVQPQSGVPTTQPPAYQQPGMPTYQQPGVPIFQPPPVQADPPLAATPEVFDAEVVDPKPEH